MIGKSGFQCSICNRNGMADVLRMELHCSEVSSGIRPGSVHVCPVLAHRRYFSGLHLPWRANSEVDAEDYSNFNEAGKR